MTEMNPNFGVRHDDDCGVQGYPQPVCDPAAARKISMAEERVRFYEEMKHKKWRRKVIGNIVSVAILLSIPVTGWYLYREWSDYRNRQAREREMRELARREADERAERLRLEQAERERRENEARRERERLEREREEAARKQQEVERQLTVEKYRILSAALRENEFDLFNPGVTNGLAATGGELCYCFPMKEDRSIPLCCVTYDTNGNVSVTEIDKGGRREPLDVAVFNAKMQGSSYLVARGGKVYFRSRQRNKRGGMLAAGGERNPAVAFFGDMSETIDGLKPVFEELTFDVFFAPKGKSARPLFCENVEFGCKYSEAKVHEAVEKAYPPPVTAGETFKVKRFKRTVKLWNGSMVKRGVDGVTYVPRAMPSPGLRSGDHSLPGYDVVWRTGTRSFNGDYAQWQSLYDKAVQEDSEESAYYAQQRQLHENRFSGKRSAAENAYIEKIERTIREGSLFYRIRKAKARGGA